MDLQTVVVAALPGFLFGGINIYTLIRFSYSLGNYRGAQDQKDAQLKTDMGDLKESVDNIGTDLKLFAGNAQKQELQMQAHAIAIEYLKTRDKIIGERTHRIANIEQMIIALNADIKEVRIQFQDRK